MLIEKWVSRVLPVIFAISVVWSGDYAYRTYFPVNWFMEAENWEYHDGWVSADISGYKLNSCTVVATNGLVKTKPFAGWVFDDVWREVGFEFRDSPHVETVRPSTWVRQSFERWAWKTDGEMLPVRLTVQHNCNGRYRTTIVGPFIPEDTIDE